MNIFFYISCLCDRNNEENIVMYLLPKHKSVDSVITRLKDLPSGYNLSGLIMLDYTVRQVQHYNIVHKYSQIRIHMYIKLNFFTSSTIKYNKITMRYMIYHTFKNNIENIPM